MSKTIIFIRNFLDYVTTVGIYDEFDRDTQKMVTSSGVKNLIKQAEVAIPAKLKPLAAAAQMRDLNDDERNKMIADDHENVVIDMRKHFQAKMSANGGAQGVLYNLIEALEKNDTSKFADALMDAQAIIRGPETILEGL